MKRNVIVLSIGAVIAAMAFVGVASSLAETDAPRIPAPAVEIAEASRKAPGTQEKTHPSPRVDGQTWGLRSYTNVRGEVCLSHDVPGELVGTGCVSAARIFSRGPLYALPGARQVPGGSPTEWHNQWIYGIAHPSVATLTVVNMDCSTQDVALDEGGAFNYVVGSEKIKKGEVPYKLIARNSAGQTIAERTIAIGLPRLGQVAGLEPPSPNEACR